MGFCEGSEKEVGLLHAGIAGLVTQSASLVSRSSSIRAASSSCLMRLQTGLSGKYGDDRRQSNDFRMPPYTP